MPYRIYRHPDIERDLFDIVDLIADYAGIVVAERKLLEIEQSIRKLSETPHTGSLRNDIHPGLRAIPTARKGVITFVVDDAQEAVFIVSITYAGADWIRRAPERTGD
ncbi:MAG: type II toxin-antitoxin system RelE/ParE family toxin [Candidatus Thiodiazotropha sp. (ex Dulcina madagascariensis)]|nr:type II toxin-antitoxin system RelE/ParE family toxin [Candidatus Thiodiazotropha sp. (ex Dulcina madagascariensis)]MCU7927678.1 type II toxin-antitoxin system RelE/ParE family toxin [Candidatus Thiodiazotropha sp. (ex Dulcina madagascariensis)]